MPHKLQIVMTLEPVFQKKVAPFYKRVLNQNDVVRGVPFKVRIGAKNIGDKEFPGGELEAKLRYGGGTFAERSPLNMPLIGVNDTQIILEDSHVPLSEGAAAIELKIAAADGDKVEGYQARHDKPVRTNGWISVFYVVNFEHAVMMMQLERISGQLERRSK